MATELTYTWDLARIQIRDFSTIQQFVVQTYWTKTGEDVDGNKGVFHGATPFTCDPSKSDYTPFAELSKEAILSWIQAQVVGEYEKRVNAEIQRQIDATVNVITEIEAADFPWAPPAEASAAPTTPTA